MTKQFLPILLFAGIMALIVLLVPNMAFGQSGPTGGDQAVQDGLTAIQGSFPDTVAGTGEPEDLVKRIIEWALYIAAILAVIFIIIGGYFYVTSAGNEDQAKRGRRTLTYAIIGLVITVLSWVIVQAIYNFLVD